MVRVCDRMPGPGRLFRGGHRLWASFRLDSGEVRIAAPCVIAGRSVRTALDHVARTYGSRSGHQSTRDSGRENQRRHPSRYVPTDGREHRHSHETASGLRTGQLVSGPQERPVYGDAMTIDRHTVALISIIGSSMDVLGALYLSYDLLGGEHGPLRTVTRGVTY